MKRRTFTSGLAAAALGLPLRALAGPSKQPSRRTRPLRCVVVGDDHVGKTSLIARWTTGSYTTGLPTVIPPARKTVRGLGAATLQVTDTANTADYDRLRPLAYRDAEVVIVCFAWDSRSSLVSIAPKWLPEIARHCSAGDRRRFPVVLVGCKSDMRLQSGISNDDLAVPLAAINKAVHSVCSVITTTCLGVTAPIHCSAKTGRYVDDVFSAAARAARAMRRG